MDIHSIFLAATEAVQHGAEAKADESVLGTLGINWKLFLAQLVNFGLVLFIFWKWVVKPWGKTLTDRQEKIEKGLKYSDAMEVEKKKFDEWKTHEMKKVRSEADNILRTSIETAEKQKMETIGQAHKQADALLQQTKQALETEKDEMIRQVKSEAANLVIAASEKILKAKLDTAKDKELISESLKQAK